MKRLYKSERTGFKGFGLVDMWGLERVPGAWKFIACPHALPYVSLLLTVDSSYASNLVSNWVSLSPVSCSRKLMEPKEGVIYSQLFRGTGYNLDLELAS